VWRASLLLLLSAACSAPATPRALARAEAFAQDGDDQRALASYDDALAGCDRARPNTLAARWCGSAFLGRADTLDRLGRHADAAAAFERAGAFEANPADSADGWAEAGNARLKLGQIDRAYDDLWNAIITWPDEAGAERALRTILRDGRVRGPAILYQGLAMVAMRLADSEIADDALYDMADLATHELHDPPAAIDVYDRLARLYPKSSLRDDSLWNAANLARAEGDALGALKRYRQLTAARETSYIVGSYNSPWMDDAQLAIALVLRDDLNEPAKAVPELQRIPKDYPTSTLLDDALYELAVTYDRLGDHPHACATLATLHAKFPDSRYESEDAPKLVASDRCGRP
jgi:tetratricopeptide (TPR) repeat protein